MKDLPAHPPEPPPVSPAMPSPYTRYYMKLEPGAPPPPDLPPDAQRFRLVEDDAAIDRQRIATGGVVALIALGVALAAIGAWGGFVAAPFVLSIGAMAWGRGGALPRYEPSDTGDYVLAPRSVVAERLGALATADRMTMPGRIVCGTLGLACIALLTEIVVDGGLVGEDVQGLAMYLFVAALGVGMAYSAVKGDFPFSPVPELPPSPWFESLADPSLPLPDDAPLSGRRGIAPASPRRDGEEAT
jgi:hypothetical protein